MILDEGVFALLALALLAYCVFDVIRTDATRAIDEKCAQDVVKRALRIGRVLALVHRLTVCVENRF